jgi:hypothetical protein
MILINDVILIMRNKIQGYKLEKIKLECLEKIKKGLREKLISEISSFHQRKEKEGRKIL